MRMAVGLAAMATLAAPAMAFDKARCGPFVEGVWSHADDTPVAGAAHSERWVFVFNADRFVITSDESGTDGAIRRTRTFLGTFSAAAGSAADTCALTMTQAGKSAPEEPMTVGVIDDNTIDINHRTFRRQPPP